MEYIKIGVVVNTFGLKGEMKVYPDTDFIEDRFCAGNKIFINHDNIFEEFEVLQYRIHKGMVLLTLKGNDDINKVEKFKNCDIYFVKTLIPSLKNGEYYFYQLAGLEMYNQDNKFLGTVLRVESGSAHNNLRVVMANKKNFLVPYIPLFVKSVDLNKNMIIINEMEGLIIDEN